MESRSHSVQVLLFWFMLAAIIVSAMLGCGGSGGGDESPVPASPTLMPFGEIIAAYVPARSGPGEGHDAIGTFDLGDGIEILGSQGQWYQVRSDQFSVEVWVFAKFVRSHRPERGSCFLRSAVWRSKGQRIGGLARHCA